jgi:N4-(beta-N-acetylglucosaminyl)-L-asparaginase
MPPKDAGLDALKRIVRFHNNDMDQLRYIGMTYYILRKDGEFAGVALWSGNAQSHSKFAVHDGKQRLEDCVALLQGASINWPPIGRPPA